MAQSVELQLSGFKKLKAILSPGTLPERFRRHVEKATKLNALIAEGEVKKAIYSGTGFKPNPANKPLTKVLKGSDRPLVDTGELVKSIAGEARTWDEAVIGVLRQRVVRGRRGQARDVKNVAAILHEGATIKVTPKMRAYFFALSHQYPGLVFPLKPTKRYIVIPRRPFLRAATNSKVLAMYQRNWEQAIQKALSTTT